MGLLLNALSSFAGNTYISQTPSTFIPLTLYSSVFFYLPGFQFFKADTPKLLWNRKTRAPNLVEDLASGQHNWCLWWSLCWTHVFCFVGVGSERKSVSEPKIGYFHMTLSYWNFIFISFFVHIKFDRLFKILGIQYIRINGQSFYFWHE